MDAAQARRGDRVLCLNPTGSLRPAVGSLAGAIGPVSRGAAASEALVLKGRGASVTTINPDAASVAAMGVNLMDHSRRQAVIDAGLAQGRRLAAQAQRARSVRRAAARSAQGTRAARRTPVDAGAAVCSRVDRADRRWRCCSRASVAAIVTGVVLVNVFAAILGMRSRELHDAAPHAARALAPASFRLPPEVTAGARRGARAVADRSTAAEHCAAATALPAARLDGGDGRVLSRAVTAGRCWRACAIALCARRGERLCRDSAVAAMRVDQVGYASPAPKRAYLMSRVAQTRRAVCGAGRRRRRRPR